MMFGIGTVTAEVRVAANEIRETFLIVVETVETYLGAGSIAKFRFYEDNMKTILRDPGTTPCLV